MFVLFDNCRPMQYGLDSEVEPLDFKGDVVVAMDPSKTNFAMIVGTPTKQVLQHIEFSGNNRKRGPAEDTTVYCEELKRFFGQYFAKTNVYLAGIEAAITAHRKGENHYAMHVANMVLTEIRGGVLSFFMEKYHVHINEVNNWTWKAYCLPEGYRGRDQKYSRKFLHDTDPSNELLAYYEADMCDAYFIYQFLCETMCTNYQMICNQVEKPLRDYSINITTPEVAEMYGFPEVIYNELFTVTENIAFYINRIKEGFYICVPADALSLDTIYESARGFDRSIMKDKKVGLVVNGD